MENLKIYIGQNRPNIVSFKNFVFQMLEHGKKYDVMTVSHLN